ncbi:uncharacterized protein C17orf64 homolog [Sceloporus undulatus]|uniref:uncharacterized protein C17orf64 homolog n=1 Tax=Sceloporus undulatus TaxID=8520 RepID=UPI001C4A9BBC|nr:uncharacterized protein C17orf64 homolog [Sceloporus undulatus]
MEFPRGQEEREIWPLEKVGDENPPRMIVEGQQEAIQSCQETESQLPNRQAIGTTSGEAFARAAPSGDALVQCADGLSHETFKICKEYLRPFKRCLRKLNLPKDFPREKRLRYIRKNLIILGDHINKFLQDYCKKWEQKHWKKMLWRFVSLFSVLDEKQLCKLYHYGKTDQKAKFTKAYCRLEKSNMVALPEKQQLQDTWDLHGQENPNLTHSLSPSGEQPSGSSPRKRLQKSSSRTKRKGGTDKPQPTQEPTASPGFPCGEGTASPSTSQAALLNFGL